ncbi:MAG: hypothetical protein AB7E34_01410 [Acidaminococcaceae bacterium]
MARVKEFRALFTRDNLPASSWSLLCSKPDTSLALPLFEELSTMLAFSDDSAYLARKACRML